MGLRDLLAKSKMGCSMGWHVELLGDAADLEALAAAFAGDGLCVVRDARRNEYLLQGGQFEVIQEYEQAFAEANRLMPLLSGAARLAYGARKSFETGALYQSHLEGPDTTYVRWIERLALDIRMMPVSLQVTRNGLEPVEEVDPVFRWLPLAVEDRAVSAALQLYGVNESPTWVRLYSILDVIEDDAGGIAKIAALCGITMGAIERLQRTACSFDAVGVESRHAKLQHAPPSNPMPLGDARLLVALLLRTWLDLKLQRPTTSG